MPETKPEADAREALSFLLGARVQRIDAPSATLFSFTLYDQGQKQSLIFSLVPPRPDLGLVTERPKGQPASAFVGRLRAAIENARLSEAHWLGGNGKEQASAIRLAFVRAGETTRIAIEFSSTWPNLYLLGADGVIVGAANERARRVHFPGPKAVFFAPERTGVAVIENHAAALERGSALVQTTATSSDQNLRTQARSQAKAALKRLTRKAAAIRADLARADSAPVLRREANLLLCHLTAIGPGCSEVQLEDLSSGAPELLQIQLDPSLSALANAERRFARARRMQRGAGIAQARLLQTEAELAALIRFVELNEQLDASSLIHEAAAVGITLDAATPGARTPGAHKARQTHVPYRIFEGASGARILVGKGAADNDALTLTVARPHDLWLHARGLHGAHVIVPHERGAEIAPELVLDAAHLAVHFSNARTEASAEVQHVERRYVRKPKGSAPGTVRVDRERVLLLRVDNQRLERLLASEQKP